MVRLYLFAEGQTEQTFADNVLQLHLAQWGIYIYPVLIAHAKRKGKIHRGGSGRGNYEPMKNDIIRFLKQEKSADVFFTTMIDLYAIHGNFPGLSEANNLTLTPQKWVEFLERRFAEDINDPRFIPYIQLHEYEAYLFADLSHFSELYDNCTEEIKTLQDIADEYETPELINDGENTAPSKRIIAQFPAYKKAKVIEGSQLAELIGLKVIRSKCPHFNDWLSRLEGIGINS